MYSIDRLIRDLPDLGARAVRQGDNQLVISSCRDRRFDPPVVLRATPQDIDGYLDALRVDAAVVFPEAPAREGAYRLLLVHLEETLLSNQPAPRQISLREGRLVVSRAPEVSEPG